MRLNVNANLKESTDTDGISSTFVQENSINSIYNNDDVIYPVTEACNSSYTRQVYKTSFNRFMKVINIHDLQVLRDLGPKVMEQMVVKYVIHARDVKKLSRASILTECNAIYHFCELNDLILNKKRIRRFFPPDESAHDDRLYTD